MVLRGANYKRFGRKIHKITKEMVCLLKLVSTFCSTKKCSVIFVSLVKNPICNRIFQFSVCFFFFVCNAHVVSITERKEAGSPLR